MFPVNVRLWNNEESLVRMIDKVSFDEMRVKFKVLPIVVGTVNNSRR